MAFVTSPITMIQKALNKNGWSLPQEYGKQP